jgi:hypothetical protein
VVGNFLPTLATPKIGGAPLEELQEKKWSGANFLWSGVECTHYLDLVTSHLQMKYYGPVREHSGIRPGNLYPCVGVSTGLGPTEFTTIRVWT